MTSSSNSSQVLNVPNVLTAARLVLAIVVFGLIPLQFYLAAIVVFVICILVYCLEMNHLDRRHHEELQRLAREHGSAAEAGGKA